VLQLGTAADIYDATLMVSGWVEQMPEIGAVTVSPDDADVVGFEANGALAHVGEEFGVDCAAFLVRWPRQFGTHQRSCAV
jgi:hypothetical protein